MSSPASFADLLQQLAAQRDECERKNEAKRIFREQGMQVDDLSGPLSAADLQKLKEVVASISAAKAGNAAPAPPIGKKAARASSKAFATRAERVWASLSKEDLKHIFTAAHWTFAGITKEQMRDRLAKAHVRPKELLSHLSKERLVALCEKMGVAKSGSKKALAYRIMGGEKDPGEADDTDAEAEDAPDEDDGVCEI